MAVSYRLVVFNALMLRGLVVNDDELFPNELAAFRTAFDGSRFRLLLTDGIRDQYELEARRPAQYLPQNILNSLSSTNRFIFFEEQRLNRLSDTLEGLPQEHTEFVYDAIAAKADYLVTNNPPWLRLSSETADRYGLQIVTPATFVELEG